MTQPMLLEPHQDLNADAAPRPGGRARPGLVCHPRWQSSETVDSDPGPRDEQPAQPVGGGAAGRYPLAGAGGRHLAAVGLRADVLFGCSVQGVSTACGSASFPFSPRAPSCSL